MGGDEVASAFDEGAELVALRVAESGDVGQDEGLVWGEMGGVEKAVVHHLEGDARFDEGLIPAEGVVFDFCGVLIATVVPGGLLRVDQGDPGQRLLVGEVGLVLFGPEIDLFDAVEPALVVERGGEFAEPGTHAVGDGVEHPDANFGVAVDAVLPAVGLFEADAEEADDGLVAHGGAILLGGFAHEPRGLETAASLTVGDEHGSAIG